MVLFVTFSKFDHVTKINFLVKMWANTSQKIIPKQSALNDAWALVHHNLSTFATAHKRTQQNSFLSREIKISHSTEEDRT